MARPRKFDREHALQQAVHLFWQNGYHATSMKQLETTLDMRPGSLYATFGNKDGLFREALDTYAGRMSESLSGALSQGPSVMAGLFRYLRSMAGRLAEDQAPSKACLMVKTLLEVSDGELREQVNARLASVEALLTTALTNAQDHGELPATTDPRRLARLVQAQIMGLRTQAQRHLPNDQIQALADDMIVALAAFAGVSPETGLSLTPPGSPVQ